MSEKDKVLALAQSDIKRAIEIVLARKKNRNQEWFAKASGISKSSISFVLAGKRKVGYKVLALAAKFLMHDLNRPHLPSELKNNLKKFLAEFDPNPAGQVPEEVFNKIERYLLENSQRALHAFLLSTHAQGVSGKELYDLGKETHTEMMNLVRKKWVYESEGRYHCVFKDIYFKSNEITRRLALIAVSVIRPENWNVPLKSGGQNFCMVINQSLSPAAVLDIVSDLVKLTNKIERYMADPKKQGELHIIFLSLLDFLTCT